MKKTLSLLIFTFIMCLSSLMCVSAYTKNDTDGYLVWDFTEKSDAAEWTYANGIIGNVQVTDSGTIYDIDDERGATVTLNFKPSENNVAIDLDEYKYVIYKFAVEYTEESPFCDAFFWNDSCQIFRDNTIETASDFGKLVTRWLTPADDEMFGSQPWTGDCTSFTFCPILTNDSFHNRVRVVMFGLFKDEAAYYKYLADDITSRFDSITLEAKTLEDAKQTLEKEIADIATNLYLSDSDLISFSTDDEVRNSTFFIVDDSKSKAPTETADGELVFTLNFSVGDPDDATKQVKCDKECKAKILNPTAQNIILNFDNVIMTENIVSDSLNVELVSNLDAKKSNDNVMSLGLLGGNVAKLTLKDGKTDFKFSIVPGKNGIPAIDELEDYKYVVLCYKTSKGGAHKIVVGNDTVNFTTDTADAWKTNKVSASWSGKPEKIDFEFIASASSTDVVYLDYIGFFATEAKADAFIAKPALDAATISNLYNVAFAVNGVNYSYCNETLYTAMQDAPNANKKGTIEDYFTNDDGKKNLASEITEMLAKFYTGDTPSYIHITKSTDWVAPTLDNPAGIAPEFSAVIVYSDAINNGYSVTTDELTFSCYSPTLVDNQFKGVQYRADGTPGMRFGTKITYDDVMTGLRTFADADVTDVSYGMVIFKNYLGFDEIRHENIKIDEESGESYIIADDGSKVGVVDVVANNIYESTDEYCIYTAVLTGIPSSFADASEDENQVIRLGACPYVKYTYNGETHYSYTFGAYYKVNGYTLRPQTEGDWGEDD